ncbi:hypothetical protein CSV79_01650 [Sporosarcina sp. P13]|uniref:hypothetical protein n=1 Tax=Sporosarcina sp. P13 TaxID=2048263 RepID=UPI000C166C47|nr:hypothetical protein [Sporosarcina sp. P13]PIC65352.1 hypothetical protein CSV79_01650 [Sporosarcina sp. P13]
MNNKQKALISGPLSKPLKLPEHQQPKESIADSVRKFIKTVAEVFRGIARALADFFNKHICPVIRWMKKYEKNVARHKHNQHTRSTWHINWDTRKGNQWMNHKPVLVVRKNLR